MPLRVMIETLGCKLNQAESESIGRDLVRRGCSLVCSVEEADVYLLNTCTVTHVADRKARNMLRRARRTNPSVFIIATGCYASSDTELQKEKLADLVVPNDNKPEITSAISGSLLSNSPAVTEPSTVKLSDNRKARSFIKVQSGCPNRCAYCIVPSMRGGPQSIAPQQVLAEIKARVREGYQEVVLTGTEIGSYYVDGLNLEGLVARVLEETGIARIRLSSVQPKEISEGLVRIGQNPRVCRHWHIPLQSGSYAVLKRMRRHYTPTEYLEAIGMIRDHIPDVAITTDVMVGFPGETEAEFLESYYFCKNVEFSRIHVFPFSSRSDTAAAKMGEQVPAKVKGERSKLMQLLAREAQEGFFRAFTGSVLSVLWEERRFGVWTGLTDNYIRVYTRSPHEISGQVLPARLVGPTSGGVWGVIEDGVI